MKYPLGIRVVVAIVSLLGLAGASSLRAEDRPSGFDCTKDQSPLAVAVCSDKTASAAERRTSMAYMALYFSLDEPRRPAFRTEHLEWLNGITSRCSPSGNPLQMLGPPPTPSLECVTQAYTERGDGYRKRLYPAALEEANLSPAVMKRIQKRLVDLKFLAGGVDGNFGAATRVAIKNFQSSIDHPQANFLTAQERAMLLAPGGALAAASLPGQTAAATPQAAAPAMPASSAMSAAEPTAEPAFPQPAGGQNNESLDSRPSDLDANAAAGGQQAPRNMAEADRPSGEAEAADTADTSSNPASLLLRAPYLLESVTLFVIFVLAVTAIFLVIRRQRRAVRLLEVDDAMPVGPPPSLPTMVNADTPRSATRVEPVRTAVRTEPPRLATQPPRRQAAAPPPQASYSAVADVDRPPAARRNDGASMDAAPAAPANARNDQVDDPLGPDQLIELLSQLGKGSKA